MLPENQPRDTRGIFRQFRLAAGLDQNDLAKAGGVSRETYNRWESGRSKLNAQSLLTITGFLYPLLTSAEDQQILIISLLKTIPRPKIMELRAQLRQRLSAVELIAQQASKENNSNNGYPIFPLHNV